MPLCKLCPVRALRAATPAIHHVDIKAAALKLVVPAALDGGQCFPGAG